MLSIIVITRNEEDMLRICLESAKWADELIVYDNGSSDKTLEIAKEYTNKIYSYTGKDYSEIRNRAFKKTKGDWVLYLDADERIPAPLREELLQVMSGNDKAAYAISRRNVIFGQEKNYGPFWPDWVIRLIKRENFKGWVGTIHEHVTFLGGLGYTKNSFLHLTHRSAEQIVSKSLIWSDFDSKLRFEARHPKMSGWRFIRILVTELFKQGILRKGFFSGTIGIMDSILQSFSLFITYVKLWELQQDKPLEQTYKEIDERLTRNNFRL